VYVHALHVSDLEVVIQHHAQGVCGQALLLQGGQCLHVRRQAHFDNSVLKRHEVAEAQCVSLFVEDVRPRLDRVRVVHVVSVPDACSVQVGDGGEDALGTVRFTSVHGRVEELLVRKTVMVLLICVVLSVAAGCIMLRGVVWRYVSGTA
jgi:hypothetical protein